MAKYPVLSKQNILFAQKHLSEADSIMAGLITSHGMCALTQERRTPFQALVNSIISQQLSAKAANTIRTRLFEFVPKPFTPEKFLAANPENLRKAGLSFAKTRYILELAQRVEGRKIIFSHLIKMDDEAIISELINLPGIGRWTAEMFLIFCLKRPNVLALGDAGLQRASKLLYGRKSLERTLRHIWNPYCSVASWYLWRHWDTPSIYAPKR